MTSPNTLQRMARAMADNLEGVSPEECRYAVLAVLEALKTLDDSTVEAMDGELSAIVPEAELRAAWKAVIAEIQNQGAEG